MTHSSPEAGGMGEEGGGVAVRDSGTLTASRLQATSKRPPFFMKQNDILLRLKIPSLRLTLG